MGRKINPNLKYLYSSLKNQKYNSNEELVSGKRGVILEGSSRSGKTWSSVDLIILICSRIETHCVINIIKETFQSFKTTLYNDFNQRLPMFGIPSRFEEAENVHTFKIFGNKINLIGADKISKFEGMGCDYLYINEMLPISKKIFDQAEMRCKKFWWADYNPSVTEHYIFKSIIPRPDIGFLRTTYNDNPFITIQEKHKIQGYEPWVPGSYEIRNNELYYNDKIIDDTNSPPPHKQNIKNGTADEFNWKVYGLGLRGAMKGLMFGHVTWIDEFPDMHFDYGMDFGFVADPTVITKCAEDRYNIWIEYLSYAPMDTPDKVHEYAISKGINFRLPVTADSSDKYTGENKGTVKMVSDLRKKGWNISKVSKTKNIMYWISSMKEKKIHIIRNEFYSQAKAEQENYRLREINGISINQPIDNFNHGWDSARYRHMAFNKGSSMW